MISKNSTHTRSRLLSEGPRLAEAAYPHQQTAPTPATTLPTTTQHYSTITTSQYNPQQPPLSISTINPPPSYQYSTTSSSSPAGASIYGSQVPPSESQPSLPPQAFPQGYPMGAGMGMGVEHGGMNSMQISGSNSGMRLEQGNSIQMPGK